jgi:drug/metabolite transporter (DMT)-like permease
MLAGGALLGGASGLAGEWARFSPSLVSAKSAAAVAYLVVFGSLVAFTAYVWLLRAASPALVSTYAFVNPVVAVFLGWLLASEPVSARTLAAAAVIVAAVVLITLGESRR